MTDDVLESVRAICMSLPEVTERPSHSAATWFVRKKTFAYFMDNHHGDGKLAIWAACSPDIQQALISADPEHFYYPAYVGYRGWVGYRLDRGLDLDEVADVIEQAYRHVAPRTLVAKLDAD